MEVSADEVASALDLPGQFRASFALNSWRWLAGSLVAGVLSGMALATLAKPSAQSQAGPEKAPPVLRIAQTLLRGAIETFAKPALQSLLQGKGEKWLWRMIEKSGS